MSEENSNFHQLLNLRAQENPEIIEWLQKRDEKYTSPEIQNELLEAMALGMMWQIFPNIQNATFCTIIADQEIMIFWADETADVSNMEQLVICIRWVDDNLVPRAFYRQGRGGAGKGPRWPEGRPEVTTDLAPGVFHLPTPAGHRGQTQEHAQCTRTRSPAAKISRAKISLKPRQNQCLRKK